MIGPVCSSLSYTPGKKLSVEIVVGSKDMTVSLDDKVPHETTQSEVLCGCGVMTVGVSRTLGSLGKLHGNVLHSEGAG